MFYHGLQYDLFGNLFGSPRPSSTFTGSETAANLNSANAKTVTVKAKWVAACTDTTFNYDYTGSVQTFKSGCDGYYQFEAWGAKGGNAYGASDSNSGHGGYGAYTKGSIQLTKNLSFYVYVGGKGQNPPLSGDVTGGVNGGGGCENGSCKTGAYSQTGNSAGTGGGATDFRTNYEAFSNNASYYTKTISESSLRTRIMVAAGGGGGGLNGNGGGSAMIGGVGGGLTAPNSNTVSSYNTQSYSGGGSQTTGGVGGSVCAQRRSGNTSPGSNAVHCIGVFGNGGTMGNNVWGGGGGGWYGGGGGTNHTGPGAGGSSYISGHLGSVAVTSLSSTSPKCSSGTTIACSQSPTGYTFVNGTTQMIAGNASMPNPRGSGNITGNNGNGYARITYLGTSI